MQLIFFTGSLSWFQDMLPSMLTTHAKTLSSETESVWNATNAFIADATLPAHETVYGNFADSFYGYMSQSILAAISHTSSFTVGTLLALVIRQTLPQNIQQSFSKRLVLLSVVALTFFYFAICFLWFSAIVPSLLSILDTVSGLPIISTYTDTRHYDVISKSDNDHHLIASGSHTLSWLIGLLILVFAKSPVSVFGGSKRSLMKKVIILTTAFCVVIIGAKMKPSFIALTLTSWICVLIFLRSQTSFSKTNWMTLFCSIIAISSSITRFEPAVLAKLHEFKGWYIAESLTPNLPFCETPFAVSPWAAQGASMLAHMPYVPSILLALSYVSPTMIPTLDINGAPNEQKKREAGLLRNMLWLQWSLQFFTAVGGHGLPNPRMIANQEISIVLAFTLLFVIIKISTPTSVGTLDWKLALAVTCMPVVCFLTIGLMPVIFMSFISALFLGTLFKGAFSLFTPRADKVLLATFVPTLMILAVETFACDYLMGLSTQTPWHMLFDILFWQVVGSALDIVMITPRNGHFMTEDY